MNLIDAIRAAWGWTGIEPQEIVGDNDFGNLIVKDVQGRYWRICPEDCYCRVVAHDRAELDRLSADQGFLRDWHMSSLVDQAYAKLGGCPKTASTASRSPACWAESMAATTWRLRHSRTSSVFPVTSRGRSTSCRMTR
jgi:hypothetical protein